MFAVVALLESASQVSAQSELPGLQERPPLRTDLHGDPLLPGSIARMGTSNYGTNRSMATFQRPSRRMAKC